MKEIEYRVRVSARARYARLSVSAREGLCVVIPEGFDRALVAALVREKRDWIERSLQRQGGPVRPLAPDFLPCIVDLKALRECWSIHYRAGGARVRISEDHEARILSLTADTADRARVLAGLRKWLAGRARERLEPRLRELASERGFMPGRVSIRNQRARWGSCNRSGDISLNLKLLFLSPRQLDYVLLHELCHTRQLDHSPRFWELLERQLPDCRAIHRQMRSAWREVPPWI